MWGDEDGWMAIAGKCTRNSLTFVNTTAIAYMQKGGRSLKMLVYAISRVCEHDCYCIKPKS